MLRMQVLRSSVKINIGAGNVSQKGWITTNIEHLNL